MAGDSEDATTKKLRRNRKAASLERLQRLVDVLASTSSAPDPHSLASPPGPPPYPPQPRPGPRAPPSHPFPAAAVAEQAEQPRQLEEEDLAKRLSELTIKTFQLGSDPLVSEQEGGGSLVDEAKNHLEVDKSAPASDASPGAPLPAEDSSKLSLQELVGRVPPKKLVDKAVEGYFATLSYYIHPITRKQFRKHETLVSAAKETDKTPPAVSLALVFTLCAIGLLTADSSVAIYANYETRNLAAQLVTLAGNALTLADHLLHPTLDIIRVLLLLATHHAILAPGDDGARGVLFLTQAANAALQLDLHRDPDELPGKLSDWEKEDRRRLYWQCFLKDTELATILGRRFTTLHMSTSSTRLPLDLLDEQLEPTEGDAASDRSKHGESRMGFLLLRLRLAQLSEQITLEVFGRRPITYSRILELDSKLRQHQQNLPLQFRLGASTDPLVVGRAALIELSILEELQRIHRPYLSRSLSDSRYAFSRKTCVDTALRILEIHSHPLSRSSWVWVTYTSIMSATVLAIDCLLDKDCTETLSRHELICTVLKRLENFRGVSTVCRRGIALLTFLRDKLDSSARSFRPREGDPPLNKRHRHSSTLTPPLSETSNSSVEADLAHKTRHNSSHFPSSSTFSPVESTSSPTHRGPLAGPPPSGFPLHRPTVSNTSGVFSSLPSSYPSFPSTVPITPISSTAATTPTATASQHFPFALFTGSLGESGRPEHAPSFDFAALLGVSEIPAAFRLDGGGGSGYEEALTRRQGGYAGEFGREGGRASEEDGGWD
ncbi:hypothetical protein JCM6882_000825 [Rhodosporidiobolus microsporus]